MKIFENYIDESALVIGGKSTYPKFNQIIIAAGGAGSGKGFALKNILAIEGKTFDVDEIKSELIKYASLKTDSSLAKEFRELYGKNLDDLDLKNPKDTSNLHAFVKQKGIVEKKKLSFFLNAATLKNKPNVIFDVTFKNINVLEEISELAELGGYKKENIHIVWIVNDIEVAKNQNAKRNRQVDSDILITTHVGAAKTMKKFIDENEAFRKYADGDVWLIFNKKDTDTETFTTKGVHPLSGKEMASTYVREYKALCMKKQGKPSKTASEISKYLYNKIQSYVPKDSSW